MGRYEEMLRKYGLDTNIFALTGGIGHPGQVEAEINLIAGSTQAIDNSQGQMVKCSQCRHVQLTINNGIFWQCNLKDIHIDDGNLPVYCSEYVDKDSKGGDDDHLDDKGMFLFNH